LRRGPDGHLRRPAAPVAGDRPPTRTGPVATSPGSCRYEIVVPTIGRPSLVELLDAIDRRDPNLGQVTVVDDRRDRHPPLPVPPAGDGLAPVRVIAGHGAGPAAARNIGWRAAAEPWVVFLDDDTVPGPGWGADLSCDLERAGVDVAGVQANIEVPLPTSRRATDWERNVAGLERARWATADLAYRRCALASVGGFDDRFPRAYREDADLALRLVEAGWRLEVGRRRTVHPVRPSDRWASVRAQAGNADDVTMLVLHGRGWRARAGVPAGSRRSHLLTTALAVLAPALLVSGRRRLAAASAAGWCVRTVQLAVRRVRPGPRTASEVVTMAVTSPVLPLAASVHWVRGWLGIASLLRRPGPGGGAVPYPEVVLFDRDGTLIHDVPYNGDPALVAPTPTARRSVERLRDRGVRVAMVTNQSGVARGLLDRDAVEAVNERVVELLGPFDRIEICVHGPDDGCGCRKPAPGMITAVADALGADPSRCVVIGDIGADLEAARAAGARGILVPNGATLASEVTSAGEVAGTLEEAVDRLIGTAP
jgi:histidinol-phosphate phosphatase family protein